MRKIVLVSVLLVLCLPIWLPAAAVPPAEAWTNARAILFPDAYRLPAGAPERMAAELLVAEWFLPEDRMAGLVDALPAAEAAVARTWRALFAARRWGVYAALERLPLEGRALLGAGAVRWLSGYGAFAEAGAFPGENGVRAYLRGVFLLKTAAYREAAGAFAAAGTGLDGADPRQRVLAAAAAGFADLCLYKAGLVPGSGFSCKAGEPAQLLAMLFTNARPRTAAAAALRIQLQTWERAITAAPMAAGCFVFPGGGELHFAGAGTNQAALVRLGGRDLVGAEGPRLTWFTDGGVFRTAGIFRSWRPAPHWLQYMIDFNAREEGAGLNFNFMIGDVPETRIDWTGLFVLAGQEGLSLVSHAGAGWELVRPRPLAPFSSTHIRITEKGGMPETIELGEWDQPPTVAFRGLAFAAGSDAGLRQTLAGLTQDALAVNLPLPRQLLDQVLINLTLSRRVPESVGTEAGDDRRLATVLYQDLQGGRRSTAQYAGFAERYATLSERRPAFVPAAAWFAMQAYRFDKAVALLEAWFRDGGDEGDGKVRMQFGPFADPDALYAEGLLNSGAYEKAGAFFRNRQRVAALAGDAGRVAAIELALADLEIRAGDWPAAGRRLAGLAADTNRGLQAAVAAVSGFLAPPRAGRLRLPFLPTLPGRGRNHCVPVAAEFVLRFYKDGETTAAAVAAALGTGDEGTGFHRMTDFFRGRGFALHALRATESVLRDSLTRGVPVLVFVHVPRRLIGHVAVVVGIDADGAVYLYEPGERFAVARHTKDEFAKLAVRAGGLCFAVGRDPGGLPAADPAAAAAADYFDSVSAAEAGSAAEGARALRTQLAVLDHLAAADTAGAWSAFLVRQRLERYAVLLGLGKEAAIRERENAASLLRDPRSDDDGETLRALGGLAQALERHDLARSAWEHALARDPADVLTARLLAQSDLVQQRWKDAEGRLRTILASVDLYPELEGLASPVLNQLAMLHLLVFGNPRAAAETLLAIPGMDPGDGRLRELLTRIGETGTLRFLGLIGEGR